MIEPGKQYLFHTIGWATIGTVVEIDPGEITVVDFVTAGWVDELEEQLHSGTMAAINEWVVAPAGRKRIIPRGSIIQYDEYPHALPKREDCAKSGRWVPPKNRAEKERRVDA